MKIMFQDALRDAQPWTQIEAKDWATLPKLLVPEHGILGGTNNNLGWVRNVNIQGLTTEGYDHVAIEPIIIGLDEGVKLTVWNDDDDDEPIEDHRAIVWTILPLAPDPKLGMAINTRQSCVWYCGGSRYNKLVLNTPQNTTIRPWPEFVQPVEDIVRHGIWLPNNKFAQHINKAPQHEWGWMHWCDHLPESECEIETERTHNKQRIQLAAPRRVLREQRAQGRYNQAARTITYYQRDADRAVGFDVFTHEDALELTTAGSATESVTTNQTVVKCWSWASPANQPNSTSWPDSNAYHQQFNCAAASTGLTYGSATGAGFNFHEVVSNLSSTNGVTGTAGGIGEFSGTGLKLMTCSSPWITPPGNVQTDVYVTACAAEGDSHGDAITLTLNTTDSYADGPWTAAVVDIPNRPTIIRQAVSRATVR